VTDSSLHTQSSLFGKKKKEKNFDKKKTSFNEIDFDESDAISKKIPEWLILLGSGGEILFEEGIVKQEEDTLLAPNPYKEKSNHISNTSTCTLKTFPLSIEYLSSSLSNELSSLNSTSFESSLINSIPSLYTLPLVYFLLRPFRLSTFSLLRLPLMTSKLFYSSSQSLSLPPRPSFPSAVAEALRKSSKSSMGENDEIPLEDDEMFFFYMVYFINIFSFYRLKYLRGHIFKPTTPHVFTPTALTLQELHYFLNECIIAVLAAVSNENSGF
jgi:hypothetical protein